jgi:hypothetical protein
VLIQDFVVGTDRVALGGFGTDVSAILASQTATAQGVQITLADGTQVIFGNAASVDSRIFG